MMFPATETSILIAGHLQLPFYVTVLQPSAVAVLNGSAGAHHLSPPRHYVAYFVSDKTKPLQSNHNFAHPWKISSCFGETCGDKKYQVFLAICVLNKTLPAHTSLPLEQTLPEQLARLEPMCPSGNCFQQCAGKGSFVVISSQYLL